MDPSHSSSLSSVSQNFVVSDVVDESCVPSGSSLSFFTEEIVAYEKENDETHPVKKLDVLCTPELFVTHSIFDTLGGTVYYILKVYADVLLVKGNVYDSVDDCVVAYMKYAAEAAFVVRRSCQKRLKNGDVKQKVQTFVKERERERLLTYLEQAFIVKVASVNIGATRAHRLLTGDSDAQMLIHKADEVSKYNYREFGDVVSFDATFKTNKYKMVFVPFTVIDNNRKCVTVAAGLLKNQTTKSYIWLLKAFIKAFGKAPTFGKAPSIVVTDQDGAMMNAIEAEFAGSKHRLCMWHITQKLPVKIPAYFIDSPLCGLMRTTSRDEVFVGLRHCQIDSKSLVEGSEVCIIKKSPYIYEMPKKKKKPESVDKGKDKAEENNNVDLFFKIDGLYKVLRNIRDGSVICSCQLFVRVGILCKHIFFVFKNANVEMIPQQYILRRWTKNLIPAALRKKNIYGEKNVVVENFANEATSIVDHCVHLLSKDEPRLGVFVEKLKSLKKEVEADCPNPPSKNKTDNLDKGGKEKAIEKSLNGRNSCSLCGGTDHNKRTCPRRFEVQDEVVVQNEVTQREVVQEKVDLAQDKEVLVDAEVDLIQE
nr:protein FAR1-related sequence 5 [Tanacetum cinerariifolium]